MKLSSVRSLALSSAIMVWTIYEASRIWGQPEFWPLMGVTLVMSVFVGIAASHRREDLQARLPGAKTLGL